MYTTAKAITTARQVELINKHEYTQAAVNKVFKSFVIYVAARKILSEMTIHNLQAIWVSQEKILLAIL